MDKLNKLHLAKNVTLVSGAVCLIISFLLLCNSWCFIQKDPLEDNTVQVLIEQLKTDPQSDELIKEIQNNDLLARKAYFNKPWQLKTAIFILIATAIIFVFTLKFYYSFKSEINKSHQPGENEIVTGILTQKWILPAGLIVFTLAIIGSFVTINHFKIYSPNEVPVEITELLPGEENDGSKNENSQETSAALNLNNKEEIVDSSNIFSVEAIEDSGLIQINHNGFRGSWGNGISYCKNIPTEWDGATGKNLLWKSEIPKHGYNSPVIWEDKIFVSGGDTLAREVYCFDSNNGTLLWSKKADNIQGSPPTLPKVDGSTGLAAPSLTTDGEKVFAIFANGDIISFDMDGNRKWARNLGVPDNLYGHASSLITFERKLFIQYDFGNKGKVLALKNETGETIWETNRTSCNSWSSPVIADINGIKQLILTANPAVAGYNLESGEELWAVECMMGDVAPSVAVNDGLVYAVNEYARLAAIDPTNATIKWEDDEYLPDIASPVVSNGLLFIPTNYGDFVCYDAKTGDLIWEHYFDNGFYASPIIADNKLYALDIEGVMHILEVSPKFKEIGSPELGEEIYTTPAFADGRIYMSTGKYLYCFGK